VLLRRVGESGGELRARSLSGQGFRRPSRNEHGRWGQRWSGPWSAVSTVDDRTAWIRGVCVASADGPRGPRV